MSQRPSKPADAPWMIPCLTVRDCEAALRFYERAFGFKPSGKPPMKGPDGKLVHAEMRFQDSAIMFGREGAHEGCEARSPATSGAVPPLSLYLYCDDVDALTRQAKKAGAKIISEPEDMFWGDRMTVIAGPDGYRWMFATNVADFDPSKVPEMAGTA